MQANRLPALAGWYWLRNGLMLWRRFPVPLSMACLLGMLSSMLPGSLPWVGPLFVCLLAPALDVALLHVCRQLATGRAPALPALRAILQRNLRGLLMLGLVMFVWLSAVRALRDLLVGADVEAFLAAAASGQARVAPPGMLWGVFVYWLGMMVMTVIMWIAPALTAFADVPPAKSLVFAVISCWRNKAALLFFGLSLLLFCIPLSLLLVFGQLGQLLASMLVFGVLMPACVASNYFSLVDIFGPLPEARDV